MSANVISATAIIDRVIANLEQNGALTPHPTKPDVAGDVGLFLNNPTQLAPGAAPLVRFHRAMKSLTEHGGGTHSRFQRFFNWQHGFIARGLELYFPQDDFIAWTRVTAPQLTQGALPPLYQGVLQDHINKASNPGAVASFPVAKHMTTNDAPADGLQKETRGDLVRAAGIIQQYPALLLTSAVYQGLHLQFLHNTQSRLQETPIEPERRAVFGEAIRRLATNISNANFVRFALWTAIAYDKRQAESGAVAGPLAQQDFIAGWSLLERGGGFSTRITSKDEAKQEGGKNSATVVCPYTKLGRSLAAQEICARQDGSPPSLTHTKAYGLWCLYRMIDGASSPTHGPHRDSLVTIAHNVMPPPVEPKGRRSNAPTQDSKL